MTVGCGGNNTTEEEPPPPEPYPALEEAEPMSWADVDRGVGLHHGEVLAVTNDTPESFEDARGVFDHSMLRLLSYDEFTQQYGEYTAYQNTGANARSAAAFLSDRSLGEFEPRAGDLRAEVANGVSATSASAFASESIVIDFWRTNDEWWIRWDGLLDEDVNTMGIGPYGFAREDYVNDLLNQIEVVAQQAQPRTFVIGSEMERLWATDGGEGVSIAEWSAFFAFYQEAASRIQSVSPETQVGVGINWDRFVNEVVPAWTRLERTPDEQMMATEVTVDNAELDRAFRALIIPFVEYGGALTLMSYPQGEVEDPWYYQFLRRIPDLYMIDPGVTWYSVGKPVENSASNLQQRDYIEDFAQWNAGVNVEAVYWERLLNIDGANGVNQQITTRCRSMVEDEDKNFNLERNKCFDGMFTSLFQPKPPFITLEEQAMAQ